MLLVNRNDLVYQVYLELQECLMLLVNRNGQEVQVYLSYQGDLAYQQYLAYR